MSLLGTNLICCYVFARSWLKTNVKSADAAVESARTYQQQMSDELSQSWREERRSYLKAPGQVFVLKPTSSTFQLLKKKISLPGQASCPNISLTGLAQYSEWKCGRVAIVPWSDLTWPDLIIYLVSAMICYGTPTSSLLPSLLVHLGGFFSPKYPVDFSLLLLWHFTLQEEPFIDSGLRW